MVTSTVSPRTHLILVHRIHSRMMVDTGRQLVRNIAQDVRTPLNAISGLSALLASEGCGPWTAEQREFVSRIAAAAARAASLLDSLLTSLDVQAGGFEVSVEPIALTSLVRQLASEQIWNVARADRGFYLELEEVGLVTTDPDLVRRVIANLLSNATKYTEMQGTICVGLEPVEAIASPLGRASVAIRVADSGTGIPVDAQDRMPVPNPPSAYHETDRRLSRHGCRARRLTPRF